MPKIERKRRTFKALSKEQIGQVISQRLQQFEAEQLNHELTLAALDDQHARLPADAPEETKEAIQMQIAASDAALVTLDAAIAALDSEKTKRG